MSVKFFRLVAIMVLAAALPLMAQDRAVKHQVQPSYPELAKQMHVSGAVKLQVTIAPNGKVVDAKVIGGHPLLIDSAMDAVKRWQYEPATETSSTLVVFNFSAE